MTSIFFLQKYKLIKSANYTKLQIQISTIWYKDENIWMKLRPRIGVSNTKK